MEFPAGLWIVFHSAEDIFWAAFICSPGWVCIALVSYPTNVYFKSHQVQTTCLSVSPGGKGMEGWERAGRPWPWSLSCVHWVGIVPLFQKTRPVIPTLNTPRAALGKMRKYGGKGLAKQKLFTWMQYEVLSDNFLILPCFLLLWEQFFTVGRS